MLSYDIIRESLDSETGEIMKAETHSGYNPENTDKNEPVFNTDSVDPLSEAFADILRLRAQVYIDEMGFLSKDHKLPDGTERPDEYDLLKSTQHFCVYEEIDDESTPVGTIRLLQKVSPEEILPVEKHFGEDVGKVSVGAIEVSRFVVTQERRAEHDRLFVSILLIRAALSNILQKDSPRIYAIVEEDLFKHLRDVIGIPFEVVGEKKYIDEYKTVNYAVTVNPQKILDGIFDNDRELLELKNKKYAQRPIPFGPFIQGGLEEGWKGRSKFDDLVYPVSRKKSTERNTGFLSENEKEKLRASLISIAGVGGDGGRLAVELARLGVGNFRLADPEEFEHENLNRQEGSNYQSVGINKAVVIAKEILKINPFANIEVFAAGVNQRNITSFLKGANLVIDETEMTTPAVGVVIARRARVNNQPTLMVLNVGFGCQVTSFDPTGLTFEKRFGLSEESTIREVKRTVVPLTKWLAYIPSYIDNATFQKVSHQLMPAPSLVQGVDAAASIGATEALKHLLNRGKPVFAPRTIVHDSYERKTKIVRFQLLNLMRSGALMMMLNKMGKVPKMT